MPELAQSPNWDKFANHDGSFIEEGFPFNEGFPYYDARYELITRMGQRATATIDRSRQYYAEGPVWATDLPAPFWIIGEHLVAAWRELRPDQTPC